MIDQNTFLETLREAAEIARTSEEPLRPEEIHRYFAGMDLTAEQEEMIRQYLQKPQNPEAAEKTDSDSSGVRDEDAKTVGGRCFGGDEIQLRDVKEKPENEEGKTEGDASLDHLSDSAFYRMYLNEVREKGSCSDEQLLELYRKQLEGEDVAGKIADGWLLRIIRMAEFYKESPVNMQDLIQEGNIALWMALGEIPRTVTVSEVDSYLESSVRSAFEAHIREEAGDVDRTQAVLAKAGLLHEAQEVLARENGQTPSLRELSEYTRISVEEIQSILALYELKGD